MPWYGMHLIDRVRNQAAETERTQREAGPDRADPKSRSDQVAEALPTLSVVLLLGMASAALRCAMVGTKEWDIVATIASVPLAMVIAGLIWGQHKSSLPSGLDAAIITGTVAGLIFLVSAVP